MNSGDIEKIMAIGSMLQSSSKRETQEERNADTEKNKLHRQIKTLNNILPFLDSAMKKNIYTLIKLMEISDFQSGAALISTQSKNSFDQKGFIEAAQQYLLPEEKQMFNTLYMLTQLNSMSMAGRSRANG